MQYMMPLLCLHALFLLVPHHQVVHLLSTARLPWPNHTTRGSQCDQFHRGNCCLPGIVYNPCDTWAYQENCARPSVAFLSCASTYFLTSVALCMHFFRPLLSHAARWAKLDTHEIGDSWFQESPVEAFMKNLVAFNRSKKKKSGLISVHTTFFLLLLLFILLLDCLCFIWEAISHRLWKSCHKLMDTTCLRIRTFSSSF